LLGKELEPPFKPPDNGDVKLNFNKKFTSMPTDVEDDSLTRMASRDPFADFEYAPPPVLEPEPEISQTPAIAAPDISETPAIAAPVIGSIEPVKHDEGDGHFVHA
jgi:hypothetical protein